MKSNTIKKKFWFAILPCLFMIATANAQPRVLTVTTLQDEGSGSCGAYCSLRDAIDAAAPEGDTITFAPDLRGGVIHLRKPLTIEDKHLTIDAPNRRRITIQGNGRFRLLNIGELGGGGAVATIDGLIFRGGGEPGWRGGGIYVSPGGFLFLNDSIVTQNHAAIGGGIRVFTGGLVLFNSAVIGNTSDGPLGGAGIDSRDALSFYIFNSLIARNVATDGVGAIKLDHGPMSMVNSTVVENVSLGSGPGRVGGVNPYFIGSSTAFNNILAKNTGPINDLIRGGFGGANTFLGDGSDTAFVDGESGNIVGSRANPADPQLGPLTYDVTGMPYYRPLSQSRVINTGHPEWLVSWGLGSPEWYIQDQVGSARVAGKRVDIGAIEFGGSPLNPLSTIVGRATNASGRGLGGALITLTDDRGGFRHVFTNPAGYYRIADVVPDRAYNISVNGKLRRLEPRPLFVEERKEYADFVVN
jgi:CSLREA domain-containing protein